MTDTLGYVRAVGCQHSSILVPRGLHVGVIDLMIVSNLTIFQK